MEDHKVRPMNLFGKLITFGIYEVFIGILNSFCLVPAEWENVIVLNSSKK